MRRLKTYELYGSKQAQPHNDPVHLQREVDNINISADLLVFFTSPKNGLNLPTLLADAVLKFLASTSIHQLLPVATFFLHCIPMSNVDTI